MRTFPADLTAFILAALCVVAIAILAGLGVPIPEVLATVALVSAGGGAGAALPRVATPIAALPTAPKGTGIVQ
jgi:hypothetical protein